MKRFFRSRPVIAILALLAGLVISLAARSLTPEPYEIADIVAAPAVGQPATLEQTLSGLLGTAVEGNRITTLVNGEEIFPAMLEAIAAAERSIAFETYVYWSGDIAQRFAEALAERAAAGVEVRVLLDWQGSVPMSPELVTVMREAGAHVERFRPIRWYTLDRINNRTHRKLLIVDGAIGFTGGVGIAEEWRGDARTPEEFRDNHYRVEGPVVATMQGAFADNWLEASGEVLLGATWFPPLAPVGEASAQFVASSVGERHTFHLLAMAAIANARDHIRIGTPYFVPDAHMIDQLIDARERGVAVTVLLPGAHSNKAVVRSASRHFWGDLLEAGVRIFEYEPTMYHTKMMMVDEGWASVGSANFDERSFRLNDEGNLSVFDAGFVAGEIALFEADLAQAEEVSLEGWENRPLSEKITDWLFARLRVQL